MFAREDLVPHLLLDGGGRPPTDVRRSRGFKQKVFDNPHMNDDHRNLAVVGTADGVPLFDDQRRSAWIYLLRCANLPDHIAQQAANCHMHVLAGAEYLELDEDANCIRRRYSRPIVDD